MSEQPTATATRPAARPKGKTYGGLTRNQWLAVGGVFAAALGYILWKRYEAAKASASTSTATSSECTDANGNPIDCAELDAQELAALQNQLDQLQGQGYGGGSGSGGGSYGYNPGGPAAGLSTSTGTSTGTGTPPPAGGGGGLPYPLTQTGSVHSATTGLTGAVKTTDGGMIWNYTGVTPGKNDPMNQTGTVHSTTTGRNGAVKTINGGKTWTYTGVPSPL